MEGKNLTIEEKKERITKYLHVLNDKQIELVYDILVMPTYLDKNDLMSLANFDNNGKVDTAYPINYYRQIKDVYPSIDDANLIFDYNENTYGKMVNINDKIVKRILESVK
tara:strand:- start:1088 stop:1417 length:330 start_codon:yes stop_codon:yes gene_type:complete